MSATAEATIWKYTLDVTDMQSIEMPSDARILCVQVQGAAPCLWAVVHPPNPMKIRRIRIIGTGHAAPLHLFAMPYIGTFQLHGGALVFHVFEEKDVQP